VADVLDPAAPSGPGIYEYRLADSATIRLPGAGEPVRVYQLQVRPRDRSQPALVGTMYVDRRMGDIVRMEFTFTPVSYVDPQLDYINVLLENGLYKGRFWLPNRQQVELRRQLRELNLPAGGMIRGTMRIGNYRFNQGLPTHLFAGPPLVSVPRAQRRAFAFEEPLDAELRREGLAGAGELGEVRRQAAELMGRELLSGLPASRLDLASATSTLRYNRAEGLALGAGFRTAPAERRVLALRGGIATATLRPFAEVEGWAGERPDRTGAAVYLNRVGDAGSVGPVISGAMNTLTALLAGRDFTDPFYRTGVEARLDRGLGGDWTLEARPRVERHRRAALASEFSLLGASGSFRPVPAIDEGTLFGGAIEFRRRLPGEVGQGTGFGVRVEGGTLQGDGETWMHARPAIDVAHVRRGRDVELLLEAAGGAALGDVPAQAVPRIGGRGTVPGHPFRAWGGGRYAYGRGTLSGDLLPMFLRGRLLAAAGWTGSDLAGSDPLRQGALLSVGAGVGILFDMLRVDVARGLGRDGRWELIIEASPAFWDFL
jgi:hypothetical protein